MKSYTYTPYRYLRKMILKRVDGRSSLLTVVRRLATMLETDPRQARLRRGTVGHAGGFERRSLELNRIARNKGFRKWLGRLTFTVRGAEAWASGELEVHSPPSAHLSLPEKV